MTGHRSTTRILDMLELIASESDKKMTLTNISNHLDAPKSSIHPMLQTLVLRGYLNYNETTYIYSIGALCFEIGCKYIDSGNLSSDIDEILDNITKNCQETCHLAELSGSEVFYLHKKDSPKSIRMFSSPGKRLAAYATSLGKALLSSMSDEEVKQLYPRGLYAITEKTITSMDELLQQLHQVKETGFAFEVEESNQHIRCIAVPIMVHDKARYAISVAVPVFRYTVEKEKQIQGLLFQARKELEKKLVLAR